MVDDLRPQLGCFNISVCGGKSMVTPHIDALAARGLTFRHAYTQYAVCSPSRNSFMSGRRPDTTLTFNFKDSFRTVPARDGAPAGNEWISYPEYFKLHGYNTTGCGKTYHSGHPKNFDQPASWTAGVEYVGYNQGLGFCDQHAACELSANDTRHFTDDGLAARAIELMTSHKAHGVSPWFVAVGFIRPHVDWSSPSRFWENYPEEDCGHDVAKHRSAPATSPKIAWVDGGYVDKKSADVGPGYHFNATTPVNDTLASLWRRGYYSAVSYVDWNIGKVLTELRALEFEENTVVVLNADHGYVSVHRPIACHVACLTHLHSPPACCVAIPLTALHHCSGLAAVVSNWASIPCGKSTRCVCIY
jgi:arylsulfatase A-like enzyme